MKPDWKDAPDWAEYLAQHPSGLWFWADRKPFPTIRESGYVPSRAMDSVWQYCQPPRKCEKKP